MTLKKEKKEKSSTKKFFILIGIGVFVFFSLIILSTVISVGDKLRQLNIYLSYFFYVLSFILFYFLFLRPLWEIIFAPTFSIQTVLDKNKGNYKIYKKVAQNLMNDPEIPEEEKNKINLSEDSPEVIHEKLTQIFNDSMKKSINKIILKNAKTVMLSTAISQNGRLDMLAVLGVNLKMISEIVKKCGFRPSYSRLGRLSVNVFGTALIAEGLENMDITEILPSSTTSLIKSLPFVSTVTNSFFQGISNALLTIRIGIVTRKFLFSDASIKTKTSIRIEAFKESMILIPIVVKDVLLLFPKKTFGMFSFGKKNYEENNY